VAAAAIGAAAVIQKLRIQNPFESRQHLIRRLVAVLLINAEGLADDGVEPVGDAVVSAVAQKIRHRLVLDGPPIAEG